MTTYLSSARTIAKQAEAVGAGRVCFLQREKLTVSAPTEDAIQQALAASQPSKYKFQAMKGGKWENLGGYLKAFDSKQLIADMGRSDFRHPMQFQPVDVQMLSQIDPTALRAMFRRFLYDTIADQFLRPDVTRLTRLYGFFSQIQIERDDYFDYFLTYVHIFEFALRHGLAHAVEDRDAGDVAAVLNKVTAFIDELSAGNVSVGAEVAASNLLGQICSLHDREAAAGHFARVRERDTASLISFFYQDMGANTYFSAATVSADSDPSRTQQILSSIAPVSLSESSNDFAVAISMDPHFFRIYSPWLIYYAQQLPDIDFCFFICAPEKETDELVRAGEGYVQGLSALNGGGAPSNVSYYRLPTPDFVADPKTFFACARFYSMDVLLGQYPNVYLMDADLTFLEDPTSYFKSLRALTFGAPEKEDLSVLSPWRRHLAGDIAFNRKVLGSAFVDDLHRYLTHGLASADSWMLDQNALSYCIERLPAGTEFSLNPYNRPFKQLKFRSTWERNYGKGLPPVLLTP